MRLLDLFCGAGGAAMGYYRAGFTDIVGVDNKPQSNYPFEFVQADALEYCRDNGHKFDVIHASPPCQAYSWSAARWGRENYPDLVEITRRVIRGTLNPYIIENVRSAPLKATLMLCGTMFNLGVIRHRYFEIYPIWLMMTTPCSHKGKVKEGDYVTVVGHGGDGSAKYKDWCKAMDIYWMTKKELTQAIPPAYTEWIGRRIIEYDKSSPL